MGRFDYKIHTKTCSFAACLLHGYCILLQLQPGVQQEIYRWSRDWWSTIAINKFPSFNWPAGLCCDPPTSKIIWIVSLHAYTPLSFHLLYPYNPNIQNIYIYPRHSKLHDIPKCVFNLPLWRTIQSNLSLSRSLLENLSLELRCFFRDGFYDTLVQILNALKCVIP